MRLITISSLVLFATVAAAQNPPAKTDKPKLVNHCRDDDTYEQYVLQEFQLYRVLHLLTPGSHVARLVRMSYADSANGKVIATRYGFIQEEPTEVADRLQAKQVKLKGA